MGHILHARARTTPEVRRGIQDSQESVMALSKRYGVNPKTVQKWRKREFVHYSPMGPKVVRSKSLSQVEEAAVEFLWFAVCWYAAHGIKIERILTDNGACCKSAKFRQACQELGIRHKRTRSYRPQTSGKAERFIRTALQEWAYAQTYTHSWQRTANLPACLDAALQFSAPSWGSSQKNSGLKTEQGVNSVLTLYS